MFGAFQPPFPPPVPKGILEIEFSAENNKLYFVDCKAGPVYAGPPIPGMASAATPIAFTRTGATATQDVVPEDGHYVYAFRSGTGVLLKETVKLTFKAFAAFYSCEITKS